MGSAAPAAKSKGSRRFLMCFRPGVEGDDDAPAAVARSRRCRSRDGADNAMTYVAAGEKEGVVFPNVMPVLKPAKENDVGAYSRRRKEGGNAFAKMMRAVVFQTSLAKKMRKKKNRQKSYRPAMSQYGEPTNNSTTTPMKRSTSESELACVGGRSPFTETCTGSSSSSVNIGSGSSISGSSLISSSRSSPARNRTSSNKKPIEPKPPPTRKRRFGARYTVILLFSVLLSLITVIFWGKACAIVCTSACLFLAPRLSQPRTELPPSGVAEVDRSRRGR